MHYPKISIITASYNQAAYLEHTIKSIIEQGYPSLEYIIIDGGSTDGSLEIIKKYEPHIAHWVSEKDKGVCDAINKGLQKSTGELMACLNSDDMLHRNSLFTIAEIFSAFKEVNWLLGASTMYDERGRTIDTQTSKSVAKLHYVVEGMYLIQLESCFWRRSLWERAGGYFNAELKVASDFDLWWRFFKHDRLWITDALIGGYRARGSNQLSLDNVDKYRKEVEQIFKQHPLEAKDKATVKKLMAIKAALYGMKKSGLFNIKLVNDALRRQYDKLLNAPPRLRFDRKSQSFIIDPVRK